MTIWKFIHRFLNQSTIEILYRNYENPFIVEVREHCQVWIEANLIQSNTNLDPDNAEHYPIILQLLHYLVMEIDGRVSQLQSNEGQHWVVVRLTQAANIIKTELVTMQRTIALYRFIRRILNIEHGYVQQANQAMINDPAAASSFTSEPGPMFTTNNNSFDQIENKHIISDNAKPAFLLIAEKCIVLKAETDNSVQLARSIIEKRDELLEELNKQQILEETLKEQIANGETNEAAETQAELNLRMPGLQTKNTTLKYFIQQFLQKINTVLPESRAVIENEIINKELSNYKREPKLSSDDLDILQGHCSTLAEILVNCCEQLAKLNNTFQNITEIPTLQFQFAELYAKFLKASFIIEVQPCQIIKKGTKFNAKLRIMAGSRNVCPDQVNFGKVIATILTKAEARKLVNFDAKSNILQWTNNAPTSSSSRLSTVKTIQLGNENGEKVGINVAGKVENNEEPILSENAFSVAFQKSSVKEKLQRDREAGKSVLDIEYWILFHTEVTDKLNNGLLQKRWIWVLSSAIKIHTHAGQKSQTFETLIWVNAMDPDMIFADKPAPKSLPWDYIVLALNKKCLEMTRVPLDVDQKEYLRKKAFSVPLTNGFRPPEGHLTFDQFCKTNFKETQFTFWRWFYEIMNLTKKHLCGFEGKPGPWSDSLVHGFISREDATQKLIANGTIGSFILRFSDSMLGGIVIVWRLEDGSTACISPSTIEDLNKLSLAQRIMDLPILTYVYKKTESSNPISMQNSFESKEVFAKYLPKKNSNASESSMLANHYVSAYLHTRLKLPEKAGENSTSPRGSIFGTPPSTPGNMENVRSSSVTSTESSVADFADFDWKAILPDLLSINPDELASFAEELELSSDDHDDPMGEPEDIFGTDL